MSRDPQVIIIGGGIVGLSTAMALTHGTPPVSVAVIEKERTVAAHQTGHNSGVIHSGIYYRPGSLKAQYTVSGARRLVEFARTHGIPHDLCGKVVIATEAVELPRLAELRRRGMANGVAGIQLVGPERLREIEPHAAGIQALHVPATGIIDFVAVAERFAGLTCERGGTIRTDTRVLQVRRDASEWIVETTTGELRTRQLINCAGLYADWVARLSGCEPSVRIVPFRGEYYRLIPEREDLVRSLIYPVSDPTFPFLGVHFTRMIRGGVEAGPNAVLSFKREGYGKTDFSARELWDTLSFPGFWRLARKYWRTGTGEMYRSFSKRAFVRALQHLLPEVRNEDLQPGGAGVRAQAVDPRGTLVDDFSIQMANHGIHVLNAPSPAATASIPIGEAIAERARRNAG